MVFAWLEPLRDLWDRTRRVRDLKRKKRDSAPGPPKQQDDSLAKSKAAQEFKN